MVAASEDVLTASNFNTSQDEFGMVTGLVWMSEATTFSKSPVPPGANVEVHVCRIKATLCLLLCRWFGKFTVSLILALDLSLRAKISIPPDLAGKHS